MSQSLNSRIPVTDEMLEAASMWRQRMDRDDWSVEDDARLEIWLQADERHAAAFETIGDVRGVFEDNAALPELIAARRAVLGRFQRRAASPRVGWRAVWGWGGRAAAAFAVAAVLGVAAVSVATRGDVYRTGLGERRVVVLEDGSVLSLDAMSVVSVRYSDAERRLILKRGQARFDVAHDTSRPFSVIARDRKVIATGTAFNIDMVSPEVRVTLIEGRVLVLPEVRGLLSTPSSSAKAVELQPGQALVASATQPGNIVTQTEIGEATAWQEGQLLFEDEPLGQAVERVNRYTSRKISVADAEAAAIKISGGFNAGDVKTFLEALDGFVPVRAVYESDKIILYSIQDDEGK